MMRLLEWEPGIEVARQILDREPMGAIRAVIVGIVDEVTVPGSGIEV